MYQTNIQNDISIQGARVAVNLQNSSHKPGVSPADPGRSLFEGEPMVLVVTELSNNPVLGCSLPQQHTRRRRDGLHELLASHASS